MTHEERVYHHTYETCEGIAEHAERIASLEELVWDMNECFRIGARIGEGISRQWCQELYDSYTDDMRKLEVPDA